MTTPTEERLRTALERRADGVEPAAIPGDVGPLVPRVAAARRARRQRNLAISLAAVIAVVAGVLSTAVANRVRDTDKVDVAQPPSAPGLPVREPAIWPLSMSVTYDSAEDAAAAFMAEFVGIDGPWCVPPGFCPVGARTEILVRDDGPRGWVVTGAVGGTVPVESPQPLDVVPRRFDVVVDNPSVTVDLRDLGELEPWVKELVEDNRTSVELFRPPGPQVLVVTDGVTATVLVLHPEPAATEHVFERTAADVGNEAIVIWPEEGGFASAPEAATAFVEEYLGLSPTCGGVADEDRDRAAVVAVAVECGDATTEVLTRYVDGGWAVTGAESGDFDLDLDDETSVVAGGELAFTPTGADGPLRVELRPLHSTTVVSTPVGAGAPVRLQVPPDARGVHVLVVVGDDPVTASTRTVQVAQPPPPLPQGTCGVGADGVRGWPGGDDIGFAGVAEAALAFATEVLGFAEPTVGAVDGGDVEVRSRPSAGAVTTIGVSIDSDHRVLCARSDQGSIDGLAWNGTGVIVSGTATAFEATLTIQALALDGTVLAQTYTQAGANGEMAPYAATLDLPPSGPGFVLIGEGDASGEGRFTWAAVTPFVFG